MQGNKVLGLSCCNPLFNKAGRPEAMAQYWLASVISSRVSAIFNVPFLFLS